MRVKTLHSVNFSANVFQSLFLNSLEKNWWYEQYQNIKAASG